LVSRIEIPRNFAGDLTGAFAFDCRKYPEMDTCYTYTFYDGSKKSFGHEVEYIDVVEYCAKPL
jgi:hypothetical protein